MNNYVPKHMSLFKGMYYVYVFIFETIMISD
jgi:hypothetical protein